MGTEESECWEGVDDEVHPLQRQSANGLHIREKSFSYVSKAQLCHPYRSSKLWLPSSTMEALGSVCNLQLGPHC